MRDTHNFKILNYFGRVLNIFMNRQLILILSGILLGLLLICTTPIKNPFPQDRVTIYGRFPYDKGFELEFYQYAYSTVAWYSSVCSGFDTEKRPCTAAREVLYPHRVDDQHYELTVYRDRYFKGLLGWISDYSFFRAFKNDIPALMTFSTPEASLTPTRCDGNGRALSHRKGRFFCLPNEIHQEFKYLVLTEDGSSTSKEEINFSLYTE